MISGLSSEAVKVAIKHNHKTKHVVVANKSNNKTRIQRRDVNGIFLLNKPLEMSSNAAMQLVKKLFRAEKAGHTGVLDPLASGLLPICFGEATRLSHYLLGAPKRYITTVLLGHRTATGDREGKVVESIAVPDALLLNPKTRKSNDANSDGDVMMSDDGNDEVGVASSSKAAEKTASSPCSLSAAAAEALIKAVLRSQFTGDITQTPPMYSAVKVNGRPLYALAREGVEKEAMGLVPRSIRIRDIKLLKVEWGADVDVAPAAASPPAPSPTQTQTCAITLDVTCSKGTYIRVLGEDIAKALGTCGHLTYLHRVATGPFSIAQAHTIEELQALADEEDAKEEKEEGGRDGGEAENDAKGEEKDGIIRLQRDENSIAKDGRCGKYGSVSQSQHHSHNHNGGRRLDDAYYATRDALLLPPCAAVPHMPHVEVPAGRVAQFCHGLESTIDIKGGGQMKVEKKEDDENGICCDTHDHDDNSDGDGGGDDNKDYVLVFDGARCLGIGLVTSEGRLVPKRVFTANRH